MMLVKRSRVFSLLCLSLFAVLFFSKNAFADERLSLKNEYLEILVDQETARFLIKTTGGNPDTPSDDNTDLLYDSSSGTSYTTIALSGGDRSYRYGSKDGEFKQKPALIDDAIITTWVVEQHEITQILSFTKSPASEVEDSVSLAYRVVNRSTTAQKPGIRILLDTNLGDRDGVPFEIPGYGLVDSEYEFLGEAVPQYWYSYDDKKAPKVKAMGSLRGIGLIPPQRIVFAAWRKLSRNEWEYKTSRGDSFKQTLFGKRDSAVALFYEIEALAPQASWTIATLYGIYPTQVSRGNFWALEIGGASQGDDLRPFGVTADLKNIGPSDLSNCVVKLDLPAGLELSDKGQETEIEIPLLAKDSTRGLAWTIRARQGARGVQEINLIVSGAAGNKLYTASLTKQVEVSPAIDGELIAFTPHDPVKPQDEIPQANQDERETRTDQVVQTLQETRTNQVPQVTEARWTTSTTNVIIGQPIIEVINIPLKPRVTTNYLFEERQLPPLEVELPGSSTSYQEQTLKARKLITELSADLTANEAGQLRTILDEILIELGKEEPNYSLISGKLAFVEAVISTAKTRRTSP